MGKPKRRGSGFSVAKQESAPKRKAVKISADHTDEEQQAVVLIHQGKLQEAEAIYREMISVGTANHIVYGNLAALCGMQGKVDEPIQLLRKALELNSNYPEAHNNLGNALKEQGDLIAAIGSYSAALKLKPNYPEAHYNLGNALKEKGDITAAISSYKAALQLKCNYPEAHNNLGSALKEQGNLTAAIVSYNTALDFKPNYPEAHYNLGNALKENADPTAAIASYITALQLNPNYPEVHNNLGSTLREQGYLTAAIASYNAALKLKPDYPEAHYNLGISLKEKGELTAAIASYNAALKLRPDYPEAHCNLGNALQEQGDLTAAIASYNTALKLNPILPEAHCNLGNALQEQGDLAAAITSYNAALKLNPNHPEAHKNLAMTELLAGDYKNGWKRYEYRFQCKQDEGALHAKPCCSQWSSNESMEGIKLLLVSEQGLGDTLHFMRYAAVLRGKGASISLCAPSNLHTLIQASGIDLLPLTPEQANEVTEGYWMPLLSVPRHLEVCSANPIITESYIKTADELVSKWANILSAESRPVIGINWQGNPLHEKTNAIGRSIPLEAFAPIASKTHCLLLSLQKGFGSEQLDTCSFKHRFVSCQEQVNKIWDFLETSAIIANCDLVITSDTSVAHLAGGMGKTTWMLLKNVPDWRWGLEGNATFWYPSMRLFRQKARGNWNEVMERVAKEVQRHCRSSSTHAKPTLASQPSINPCPT